MSDRSIKITGNLTGIANTGDSNVIINSSSGQDAIKYLNEVFSTLQIQFPDSPEEFKIECVKQKVTSDISSGKPMALALKDSLLNASQELVGILSDNPFVRITVALLRGWIQ
jgi:hypothetical protein